MAKRHYRLIHYKATRENCGHSRAIVKVVETHKRGGVPAGNQHAQRTYGLMHYGFHSVVIGPAANLANVAHANPMANYFFGLEEHVKSEEPEKSAAPAELEAASA